MKDENFYINQENIRNDIRIKQGREKPIDFLLKTLRIYLKKLPIPQNFLEIPTYKHPYEILLMLNDDEKNEALNNIKYHFEINHFHNTNDISKKYWKSIYYLGNFVCDESKRKLLNEKDLLSLLENHKNDENELEKEIKTNIEKNQDIIFWKNIRCLLNYIKYKKFIENLYIDFIQKNKNEINDIKNQISTLTTNNNINNNSQLNKKKGRRKGSLSPPVYESDEELRKIAITEHDFLFDLAERRKVILNNKILEYKEKPNINIENNFQFKNNNNNTENNINNNTINNNESTNLTNKIPIKKNYKEDEKENTQKKDVIIEKAIREIITNPNNNNINNNKDNNINLDPKINNQINNTNPEITTLSNLTYNNSLNSISLVEEQIIDTDEMKENEKIFNECVQITANYDWSSKYKPIKPRYSNKVRMGFDWNKYNQAHFSAENPPPRTIQGYRFNIFYPYLIDKTKTPQYSLERCDQPDMCIIRFHSGAPYEDIAFKIKNREWDMTEKAGFKNIFDKGILRLYFKFKRYRYRR